MSFLSTKHIYPIGVDMGNDALKMIQLGKNGRGLSVIAGCSKVLPDNIQPGSAEWQRWTIEAIRELTAKSKFRGKEVIAAMPPSEVFIEHMKIPKANHGNFEEAILSKIKRRLGTSETATKHISINEDNYLIIATEREKIDRYLAIYEKTHLQIKSLDVWASALVNSYVRFFGRRKSDINKTVMLLDIETNYTNFVICRHKNLLFARLIPIGAKQLATEEMIKKLVLEVTTCRHEFVLIQGRAQIERLIFLSGSTVEKELCLTVAKQLEIPAQVADCLAAVAATNFQRLGIDRRQAKFSWATAFGLSLL